MAFCLAGDQGARLYKAADCARCGRIGPDWEGAGALLLASDEPALFVQSKANLTSLLGGVAQIIIATKTTLFFYNTGAKILFLFDSTRARVSPVVP